MKPIVVIFIGLCLISCSSIQQENSTVPVEFRLAEFRPDKDLTETTIAGSDRKFYLYPEVLISNADIAAASVVEGASRPQIEIIFTAEGKEKFTRLTEENLDKPLGIILDGELISTPIIKSAITGGIVVLEGKFTQEEAERLANGMVVK
jgi:preprotein translocase subunit SecD